MPERVRVLRHVPDGIPDSGSFEVKVDGVALKYFYWDDNAGRRSIRQGDILTQSEAKQKAIEMARSERERLG